MMSEYNTAVDPETMAVDGGILELEDCGMNSNQLQQLSSPLLQSQPQTVTPETTIEQTSQSDGSIIIKASTSTPHPNGFRDVKIEYYTIPSSAVGASDTSFTSKSSDDAPLKLPSEYLTRVEYKTVTSDNDDDASTIYTALPRRKGDHDNASISSSHCYTVGGTRRRLNRRRKRSYGTPILITFVILFLIGIIGVSITRDKDGSRYENNTRDDDKGDSSSSNTGKLKNDTLVNPTNGTNRVVVDDKNDTLSYIQHDESEILFVSLS